jgi:ferredoxin
MLTSSDIKRIATEFGADMVGIGNIDRWEGAPIQQDPRQIMPRARSVISMAFRVMRGSLRGIEEGTFFSNYSAMGYGGITYLYMPMTVINLAKTIEDEGYEAIPYGHQSDWRAINAVGQPFENYSRPVRPGRAAPDVMINQRIAAYLCGLGEIGYSKMFLTPKFGPRQRVGIVITEMELQPDPIYSGPPLCNRCMACVRDCPGQAIPRDKTIKVTLAGKEVEWADIDCDKCDITFRGGALADGSLPPDQQYDTYGGKPLKRGWWTPFYRKPRNLYNTGQAVCGARGCTRACMVSMESRGVLQNTFKHPFRTEKPWKVDWDKAAEDDGVKRNEKEAD